MHSTMSSKNLNIRIVESMDLSNSEVVDIYKIAISKNLKYLLSVHVMSILKLSIDLGLSYRTVYNMVEGNSNPTLETLVKTAKYYDIKVSQLIGESSVKEELGKNFTKLVPMISWHNVVKNLSSISQEQYDIDNKRNILVSSTNRLSDKVFALYSNTNTEPLFKSGTILVFDIPMQDIKYYNNKFVLILSANSIMLIKRLIIENNRILLQSINNSDVAIFVEDKYKILAYLVEARLEIDER